jgi:UDP-N-acetyl-2-amino-2-deoxyglucuronate dehydrogenase
VGVLGAGWAGEAHIAACSRLPSVEVTGLWSRTRARAESLAGKLGYADLRVYGDWQSLIGAGSCDVISIATAPMLRSDPLLAALDQGCHVLAEKPISVGVADARVMAAAAEAANTVTASCFNWRYAPAYQAARNPSAQARSALYAASSILTKGRLTRRSNSGA